MSPYPLSGPNQRLPKNSHFFPLLCHEMKTFYNSFHLQSDFEFCQRQTNSSSERLEQQKVALQPNSLNNSYIFIRNYLSFKKYFKKI